MIKYLKRLGDFFEEIWAQGDKRLGTTLRKRDRSKTCKITETPASDIKQISTAATTANYYDPNDFVTKKSSDNGKGMDNNDDEKKRRDVRSSKADLLKFKAEAEEFNVEFEKAMVRRSQQKS